MPLTNRMLEKRSTFHVSQQPPGYVTQGYGSDTFAGESVTVEGALSVTSVLSGFTILMEDTASLPLITYRRLKRGKERAYDSPYYSLLHDAPNPEHTSLVYREFVMGHMLGWGNHFSQKIWDNNGVLKELWPLRPDRMRVFRKDGQRKYLYTEDSGRQRAFRAEEIWHVPAFGFDGLIGYSRITLARNAIGLALATEKYGSKFFGNGANPGILIKHPGTLSDTAFKHLEDSWNARAGAENSHKPVIVEEGMSIDKIGIPPDDAQFLETRKFQVDEIARMFRIPPHMLGATEKSTSWGSGIEQQELGYLSHTLRPWLRRIEQQAWKDFLLEVEKKELLFEHLVEEFLRTDTAARMTAYVQAITNGIMSRNEARERENLLPYDGGDDMLIPLNMTTSSGDDEEEPEPDDSEDNGDAAGDDGGTDATVDDSGTPQRAINSKRNAEALAPFVLDMARRIVKRETNEVTDAVKRWLDKGKSERFIAWMEQFYKADQAEFMLRTLAPLAEIDPVTVARVIEKHVKTQGAKVFRAFQDGDDLNAMAAAWSETMPGNLVRELLSFDYAQRGG